MRLLLVLLVLALSAACSNFTPAPRVGEPAPVFQGTRLDGASMVFPAAMAGRLVAVNFWAEWCSSCEAEMKAIETVYRRQKHKGLEVLGINVLQSPKEIAAFVKKVGVSYPILLDENASIMHKFGVIAIPATIFVDGHGVVRAKLLGSVNEEVFEKYALLLLRPAGAAPKPDKPLAAK